MVVLKDRSVVLFILVTLIKFCSTFLVTTFGTIDRIWVSLSASQALFSRQFYPSNPHGNDETVRQTLSGTWEKIHSKTLFHWMHKHGDHSSTLFGHVCSIVWIATVFHGFDLSSCCKTMKKMTAGVLLFVGFVTVVHTFRIR